MRCIELRLAISWNNNDASALRSQVSQVQDKYFAITEAQQDVFIVKVGVTV